MKTGEPESNCAASPLPVGFLGEEARCVLLRLARETIVRHVNGHTPFQFDEADFSEETRDVLRDKRGVFVTLHKERALRGCIGRFADDVPLGIVIPQMAIAAATQDPRFPRVLPGELHLIHVEISVLTPPNILDDVSGVEVGRHGLIIRRGRHVGLLLPQVATEQGWNRDQFLAHACLKAGLHPAAFREAGTLIEVFEAQVFGEARLD